MKRQPREFKKIFDRVLTSILFKELKHTNKKFKKLRKRADEQTVLKR